MRADSLYKLTAACLITHELDSIMRMVMAPDPFSAFSHLEQMIYMWGHIPVVIGLLFIAQSTYRSSIRYGTCVFAVAHVGLHWIGRDAAFHDLGTMASWVLILLAGIFGAAYLVPAKAR
ncbi:hypothetical protein [Hyphomonas sp.]|jgi:hypothetical protein|uniref:hypothetical protein n=1 Tax=Hyphomonas sp. TaxID=87 RepID=UPI0025C2CC7B|nr:hypothetical protein [Hyphomonas sp.]